MNPLMSSAFISRKCEFRMILSDNELHLLNERQRSREWGEYLSKSEAIEVNGT